MLRKIIKIDQKKCNGCGACASACHEGAIGIVNGKASLLRDDYCDGLGDCLPTCPTNAISFEVREAAAYDEAAVKANMAQKKSGAFSGCQQTPKSVSSQESALSNWPVQIKLLPVEAPYFQGANLLIAADCTSYAFGNFHRQFMKDRVTVIACPKLDMVDYTEKLTAIFQKNDIASITLTRMEVPCCGGLAHAVKAALKTSGKKIPLTVCIIGINGTIISESKED